MEKLVRSCEELEESMNRMMAISKGKRMNLSNMDRDEEDRVVWAQDDRFNHSWQPARPSKGWYWIPKGRISIDLAYPARLDSIRKYGFLAKKIRPTCPPPPLSASFAAVAMDHWRGKRRQEDWRQEGWMSEDDLLGEERREQDL